MIEDNMRDIRKRCRMAMNGVASTSMRQKGLDYKLNFGVSLLKIKEIAQVYTPDKELAKRLWMEQTRELKILATLLYPVHQLTEEVANKWVLQITTQELREQVCLNLFSNCIFAPSLVSGWIASNDKATRTSGYWLLGVLLKTKKIAPPPFTPCWWSDITDANLMLRNACLVALKFVGRSSTELAMSILDRLQELEHSEKPFEQEIFNSLKFEFEYFS